jgi:site-specific DNA-methyltransferase (cytosine-N4-specific)
MLKRSAYYQTHAGSAYLGDSLEVMRELPAASVSLVVTSPPFALTFKKEYGNHHQDTYVEWFCRYAREVQRVLTDDGSFVVDLGGAWNKGKPTRSLYHYRLPLAVCDDVGFHLAQDFFWFRPAALPAPAEWVNVQRIRLKDAVNYVFWFSKTERPKADNRRVLVPYSEDMQRLIRRGYRAKKRPSGHNITEKFDRDQGGAIPPNLLIMGNNDATGSYMAACKELGIKPHPARFPVGIPSFFINLCTDPGDVVLDPFGGSNTTGFAAESLGRRWITIELREPYLKGSMLRFPNGVVLADGRRVVIASAGLRPVLESDHQPSLFEFVSAD